MAPQEINNILKKSVRRRWPKLRLNVWIYGAMTVVVLIFSVLNFVGNLTNSPWVVVHLVLTVLALGFLALSMRVLRDLRGLDESNETVAVLVQRQLRFFHTTFEKIWPLFLYLVA